MTADDVKQWLTNCSQAEREEVFRHLRPFVGIHRLEQSFHAAAEVILEAIDRAGGLTVRMFRGVMAGAAFDVHVADQLAGWQRIPITGDLPFDTHLRDVTGDVHVQVKLQRSESNRPMTGADAPKKMKFSDQMFVVGTQKSRKGQKKGKSTRPYRFGEFDILAVSLYPSTQRWNMFRYTVARWLLPDPLDATLLLTYQTVAPAPNADWTDDFLTAVAWLRAGPQKTISSQ
jgi:hypothetical protein